MWETIKNDPILRTVAIIILGILGFGFAFNIMFGPGGGGEHGHGMAGGNTAGNQFSNVFVLAFKLLFVILVIFGILAAVRFILKKVTNGGEVKMFDSIKNDPVLKTLAIVLLSILGIGLIYFMFNGLFGFGHGYGMTGNGMMGGGYGMQGGSGYGIGLSGILAVLLKLLMVLSVTGLIIGLAMYVKQNYSKEISNKFSTISKGKKLTITCPKCNVDAPNTARFCPGCGEKLGLECSNCSGELKPEWKCCPICGKEK